jgi:hypothetical protein
MQSLDTCFICSNQLLLHIRKQKKCWYCNHCREHFSELFQQQVYAIDCSNTKTVKSPQPYFLTMSLKDLTTGSELQVKPYVTGRSSPIEQLTEHETTWFANRTQFQ